MIASSGAHTAAVAEPATSQQDNQLDRAQPTEPKLSAQIARLQTLLDKDRESDIQELWQIYHSAAMKPARARFRKQFFDFAMRHKDRNSLLALCLKHGSTTTFHQLWPAFPTAEQPDFVTMESYLSRDELMQGLLHLARWKRSIDKSSRADKATIKTVESILNNFLVPCVGRYTTVVDPTELLALCHILKNHLVYEAAIVAAATLNGPAMMADRLFRAYRQLPVVKVRGFILHAMMRNVYYPTDNAAGMELVLEDYYKRFGRLDFGGYRRSMSFYARRGDVASVKRLWEEYTYHYNKDRQPKRLVPGKSIGENPDFLAILHVHAVRGELSEVRRIFAEAQEIFGAELNIMCWNILLNAHAKAGEYDGAVRVFGVLKKAVRPDKYSYGTMMGMAGSRGDLEFTLELYRMAKNDGLEPDITMIDCVVEAYCQNDKLKDAESIVLMTTQKERFSKAELVILWNTLLFHHSMRRELRIVNRFLSEMSKYKINYNGETYTHLLRGLALCRQPHHALFLIQEAVRTRAWQPNLKHYTLLMTSFMRTGQFGEALRTSKMIESFGLPTTGQVLYKVLQALGKWATRLHGSKNAHQAKTFLANALRDFRKSIEGDKQPLKSISKNAKVQEPWLTMAPEPVSYRGRTAQASLLIFVFTQLREVATIPEILELWQASSPEASGATEPPLKLLEAIMLAAYHEKSYADVEEVWKIVFERVLKMSRVSAPGTSRAQPLASTRYALNDSLKTMQRMYGDRNDSDSLRNLITAVLHAGFRLDSKNWNYYVQFLVRNKKWREAFMVCEEHLMPMFHGWQRVRAKLTNVPTRLPLDMRRRGQDPHYPRPISYTLMMLSKAYMTLESMAAWSAEAERLQVYIETKCPSAVQAVKTQLRTYTAFEEKLLTGNDAVAFNENQSAAEANNDTQSAAVSEQQQQHQQANKSSSSGSGSGSGTSFVFRDLLQKVGARGGRGGLTTTNRPEDQQQQSDVGAAAALPKLPVLQRHHKATSVTEYTDDNATEKVGDISDWVDVSEEEDADVLEEDVQAWETIHSSTDELVSWRELQEAEAAVQATVNQGEEVPNSELEQMASDGVSTSTDAQNGSPVKGALGSGKRQKQQKQQQKTNEKDDK